MPSKYDHAINVAIRKNELETDEWSLNPLVNELYWFVDFFNIAFFRNTPVPTPVLTFEKANLKSLGFYRIGLNDWAVRNQINLNKIYLDRPLSETLQTLVHEMVHSWEHEYLQTKERTHNWYHKTKFREKMGEIGIETDNAGVHISLSDPFVFLLKKHGVEFSNYPQGKYPIPLPPKKKPKGKSKLAKWTCGCTNIRVGVKDFEALCLKCGNIFERDSDE